MNNKKNVCKKQNPLEVLTQDNKNVKSKNDNTIKITPIIICTNNNLTSKNKIVANCSVFNCTFCSQVIPGNNDSSKLNEIKRNFNEYIELNHNKLINIDSQSSSNNYISDLNHILSRNLVCNENIFDEKIDYIDSIELDEQAEMHHLKLSKNKRNDDFIISNNDTSANQNNYSRNFNNRINELKKDNDINSTFLSCSNCLDNSLNTEKLTKAIICQLTNNSNDPLTTNFLETLRKLSFKNNDAIKNCKKLTKLEENSSTLNYPGKLRQSESVDSFEYLNSFTHKRINDEIYNSSISTKSSNNTSYEKSWENSALILLEKLKHYDSKIVASNVNKSSNHLSNLNSETLQSNCNQVNTTAIIPITKITPTQIILSDNNSYLVNEDKRTKHCSLSQQIENVSFLFQDRNFKKSFNQHQPIMRVTPSISYSGTYNNNNVNDKSCAKSDQFTQKKRYFILFYSFNGYE